MIFWQYQPQEVESLCHPFFFLLSFNRRYPSSSEHQGDVRQREACSCLLARQPRGIYSTLVSSVAFRSVDSVVEFELELNFIFFVSTVN